MINIGRILDLAVEAQAKTNEEIAAIRAAKEVDVAILLPWVEKVIEEEMEQSTRTRRMVRLLFHPFGDCPVLLGVKTIEVPEPLMKHYGLLETTTRRVINSLAQAMAYRDVWSYLDVSNTDPVLVTMKFPWCMEAA